MIFKDNGNLRIPITEVPVNVADQKAAYMVVTGIIPEDGTIRGDLYDAKDKLIAKRRVYRYSGVNKNIPFADIAGDKVALLDGELPTEAWTVDTIKLYLDKLATTEDDKVISVYDSKMTKAELLGVVNPVEIEKIEPVAEK